MAVVDVATAINRNGGGANSGQLAPSPGSVAVPLAGIAERQGLSRAYLEQLFMRLRRAGVVQSVRGAQGGYQLARAAGDISIADIVGAVDEPLRATRCGGETPGCLKSGQKCQTHDLWHALGEHIHTFLAGISVADVVENQFGTTGQFGTADMGVMGVAGRRAAFEPVASPEIPANPAGPVTPVGEGVQG